MARTKLSLVTDALPDIRDPCSGIRLGGFGWRRVFSTCSNHKAWLQKGLVKVVLTGLAVCPSRACNYLTSRPEFLIRDTDEINP